ncbi:hypothetical protein ACSBR2_034664 [Camellia fascicularis]
MRLSVVRSFVSIVAILSCMCMPLLHKASQIVATTVLDANETDYLALLSIKAQITHDPMLVTSSWNDSLHFCQWEGALCGHRHRRVIALSLESRNLVGSISPSIGNLSFLRTANLSNNSFQGEIPHEMGRLFRLQVLVLTRAIPTIYANLSSLERFLAHLNMLEGSIPKSLGGLKSLTYLSFFSNKLSDKSGLGTGHANDLNFLTTLANCSKLRVLQLQENNFGGVLSNSLANFSTKLEHLSVAANQISGNVLADIGNLVSLNALAMDENQLVGSIPTSIGKLVKFQDLGFSDNKLSGEIPSSIGNLTLLNRVLLEENYFQGNIPSSLGNCQGLILLHLYGNGLFGSIPREVIGLSSLSISLDLSRNCLTGPIPVEVGNLKNLVELNLSHNKLSGGIPSSLASCTYLERLYLDNNSFGGTFPQSLSSLKTIEELSLSYNNLSGEIPKFLEGFPFLRNLNLSFNNLEGEVPVGGVFLNATAISVSGNNKLCGGMPALQFSACASKKPRKLIIPIVYGVLGIILVSSILILCWLRKTRKQSCVPSSLIDSSLKISYGNLLKATNGFSLTNLIGTGSFGLVYKGILHPNEMAIAVKVLHQQNRGASKSFVAECKTLRNIRHRNLVKIISVCASVDFQGNDFKALIYEFMENESLESWLHPVPQAGGGGAHEQPKSLSLFQRLGIAIDVAYALDYLHNHCHIPVIHCDIKPSNILLNNDITGHVGDFGLARLLQHCSNEISQSQTSSVGIKGTVGYIALEYGMGSQVSIDGDVYSYGILLLELFMGKRPADDMFKDGLTLHKLASTASPERVMEIVDQKLVSVVNGEEATNINSRKQIGKEKFHECLILILRIGVACSEESPRERMAIVETIKELHLVKDMLLGRRISSNVQTAQNG